VSGTVFGGLKLSLPAAQVAATGLRLRTDENSSGYQGVAAPKRKRVEEEPTVDEIPKVRCVAS
jgi:hypothetical protein